MCIRDSLKTILHRIYGRFMTFRLAIRKAINHIFYEFTYEADTHAGIGELLEILGSIINGFALPLKDEHKSFLRKYLLPLYKPRSMLNYHPQLCYCIVQFVEKDPALSSVIIQNLLRWWPHSNSQKEVAFLNEIEEVVDATHSPEENLSPVAAALFRRIAKCILSENFQVAERALCLWQARTFTEFCRDNLTICLPILYPALSPTEEHWNQGVQQLSCGVLDLFKQIRLSYVEEVRLGNEQKRVSSQAAEQKRADNWRRVEEMAAANRAAPAAAPQGSPPNEETLNEEIPNEEIPSEEMPNGETPSDVAPEEE
eukprot:TRINITY_DN11689_c0_g1_i6.p1 TRINITY_DN11689_c0_g1~~TRINITY_DN11689_c0_g1_i6.p1  ORF type:complete len:313 (+),score=54.57 TRINITY_DN11689_c0_g1_i6:167-1105(+)